MEDHEFFFSCGVVDGVAHSCEEFFHSLVFLCECEDCGFKFLHFFEVFLAVVDERFADEKKTVFDEMEAFFDVSDSCVDFEDGVDFLLGFFRHDLVMVEVFKFVLVVLFLSRRIFKVFFCRESMKRREERYRAGQVAERQRRDAERAEEGSLKQADAYEALARTYFDERQYPQARKYAGLAHLAYQKAVKKTKGYARDRARTEMKHADELLVRIRQRQLSEQSGRARADTIGRLEDRAHDHGMHNNFALLGIVMSFVASIVSAATSFTGFVAGGGIESEMFCAGWVFFAIGIWGLFLLMKTHRR